MVSPILTVAEMRAAEEAAFARGTTAESLMDEAARGIAAAVSSIFPQPARCIVFAGKGNNAGDAFAAAELLSRDGWQVDVRLAFNEADLGTLARNKLASLRAALAGNATSCHLQPQLIVLDGLLGIGATPPLREPICSAGRELNRLRTERNAFVFAIDVPSGLDADTGDGDADCVVADWTVTIGFAKRGLIADAALEFVGRLEVAPLSVEPEHQPSAAVLATRDSLRPLLRRRAFGAYKNQFGRIGIVAGSRGFTGAAVLCSLGALRGGAGLVQLFVPEEIYELIAASAPPEVMVKPVTSYRGIADEPIDVWAVGPGLGREHDAAILDLIASVAAPMVLDADALNALATHMPLLQQPCGPRLVTPHPGEMKRLFPRAGLSRAAQAEEFCAQYPVTLLLKGSRTIVAGHGAPSSYNTTGNPGMSTGGMGDVLTGVCAALIGQKLSPSDAARLGAWVCGRAAELAIFRGTASEQSLLPSDVIAHLGLAFRELQSEV
ncbi:MAG: NAD(P)H-hydrate dehydratase [Verrucomicrobiota bacterium]|nr:NAD(P)H-hydrate dehydratase [Verrucomicrobiota bacterium]